jgi:UDP-2-acetamido-2-deoxy-ribo-hexuluronate aminotransferase
MLEVTEVPTKVPVDRRVPYSGSTATFNRLWPIYREALQEVMRLGKYSHGFAIGELEHAVAEATGARFAVAVNSGYDAALLGLKANGVKAGDQVAVSSCASAEVAIAIAALGATPVFVDIDSHSFDVDESILEDALTEKMTAVVVSNPVGRANVKRDLLHIASRRGLVLLEDFGEAFGRYTGTVNAAAVSFAPGAMLGGIGDAGMLLTNDHEVATTASLLRHHGRTGDTIGRMPGVSNRAEICGTNSKMDDFLAAYLRARLQNFESEVQRLRLSLECYLDLLGDCSGRIEVPLLSLGSDSELTPPGRFVILSPERDELRRYLFNHGVEAALALPMPLHRQPCFRGCLVSGGSATVSEGFSARALALPFHSNLTTEHIAYVSRCIRKFYKL